MVEIPWVLEQPFHTKSLLPSTELQKYHVGYLLFRGIATTFANFFYDPINTLCEFLVKLLVLFVITQNLPEEASIGVDPWCISIDTAQRWERALEKKQQKLVSTSNNLVDQIWKDRPEAELNPVKVQALEFAGRTVADKLQDLREKLMQEKAHSIIICALDEVTSLGMN